MITQQQYDELKAERDALAAHALELIKACQLAVSMFVANDINVPNTIETLQDAIDATPRLCLAEIRAEAGRAGYLQGRLDAMGDPDEIDKEHAEFRASQYAAKLRQGAE